MYPLSYKTITTLQLGFLIWFLTLLMLYVLILYISGGHGTYSFKVDSERQFFLRNFSWQFLFILRVFAKNLLRGNRRSNTFCILFECLAQGSNPGFTFNKPTHYLIDYGEKKEKSDENITFIMDNLDENPTLCFDIMGSSCHTYTRYNVCQQTSIDMESKTIY